MSQRRIKATREEIRRELGATGDFPRGHLSEHDEGEIRFAIATDPKTGTVVLEFGKPVAWLGLPPATAREMGEALIKHANAAGALPYGGLPS